MRTPIHIQNTRWRHISYNNDAFIALTYPCNHSYPFFMRTSNAEKLIKGTLGQDMVTYYRKDYKQYQPNQHDILTKPTARDHLTITTVLKMLGLIYNKHTRMITKLANPTYKQTKTK